jgi:hypothetical protein
MGREDGGAMTCVRTAWLTLGASELPLEDERAGYFCELLDLGYPVPREVSANVPDQDGAIDRTALMGPRVVTVSVHALAGVGARIDAVASAFAPYMVPSARPVLHYVLDRPGEAERVLTLRPAAYGWPIVGPNERVISLQWVAPDPIVRDPNVETSTAWAGTAEGGGRIYNLVPPREYPPGGAATVADVQTYGDLPARPLLRIYGPITGPAVTFHRASDGGACGAVPLVDGYAIEAGHYVEVDTQKHTAYLDGDRGASVLNAVDWLNLVWPVVPTMPDYAHMALAGDPGGLVTSGVTQVQAQWQDGYLT